MLRYFLTIREATELVLQAAARGLARPEKRGHIFVLDMGEPVRIVDLAKTMIALFGCRPDIDIGIAYTGLRPGEKMFEELFDPGPRPTARASSSPRRGSPRSRHCARPSPPWKRLPAARMWQRFCGCCDPWRGNSPVGPTSKSTNRH
jgi:FlaA1/EpsC-like NDP-sugar epimerase